MEFRYLKDFAISLIFILLFAFAVKDYTIYQKVINVPEQSKYSETTVSEELMDKIKTIEASILDRKMFSFYVPLDPLRQDPVVKDKMDRLKEWEEMIANMVRLAATFIDEEGHKAAIIAYQGKNSIYRIGDTVAGRRIEDIRSGQVIYTIGGTRSTMIVQPIPPKPVELESTDITEYNY